MVNAKSISRIANYNISTKGPEGESLPGFFLQGKIKTKELGS
jgi:hypothetical protein